MILTLVIITLVIIALLIIINYTRNRNRKLDMNRYASRILRVMRLLMMLPTVVHLSVADAAVGRDASGDALHTGAI